MFLYNYTLVSSTQAIESVVGLFDGGKQVLVVATGSGLEIFRQTEESLVKVASQYNLGIIQQVNKIKPVGYAHDLLLITGDSGCVNVYEFVDDKFKAVLNEPYSKNGLRSTSPGTYMAIDPKSRALMISAVDKSKFIYKILVEDDKVVLSSPLPGAGGITVDVCSVDTQYNNPKFAAIEIESQIVLNYYELDQGLNHVIKKSHAIPLSANMLIPYNDTVVVCCDGLLWIDGKEIKSKGQIVNYVTHKLKKQLFVLLQNDSGELLKFDGEKIETFGKVDVCRTMQMFKNGFLYGNSEGKHQYWQVVGLDTVPLDSSSEDLPENLELITSISTLDPILDLDVQNSVITTASTSEVSTLSHTIPVSIMVESPLPLTPTRVFTTKLTANSKNDEYLVLSSESETLVLSIGEVVEQVTDSKFSEEATLLVQQVGKQSVVQVYTNGIKHINEKVTDWYPPAGINIVRASSTPNKIIVGLSNHELVYFEVDQDDQLVEYQERLEMPTNITGVCISTNFCIVGCADESVQVISVKPHSVFDVLSVQMLSSNAHSIEIKDSEVHIGMDNGLYVRTTLDVRGQLSNSRSKYVGTRSVKLRPLGQDMLVVSSQAFISSTRVVPLDIQIEDGVSFYSEDIGDAIVGIRGNDLIIFSVDGKPFSINAESSVCQIASSLHQKTEFLEHVSGPVTCYCEYQQYTIVGTHKSIFTFSSLLVHETPVELSVRALFEFNGQIFAAIGNTVRLYEIGKKQLLKKYSMSIRNQIVKAVHSGDNRIVIGDIRNSTIFCKFEDNRFQIVAEDTMARSISCLTSLDHDTVIGSDKFGNIFVNRMESQQPNEILNGAPGRVRTLAQIYVNDVVMKFIRCQMMVGGDEVILYGGLSGMVGVMVPISAKDYEWMKKLENEMAVEGRTNRSYYNMSHNVVDGDLVEQFVQKSWDVRGRMARQVGRSIDEIDRRIEDMRERVY